MQKQSKILLDPEKFISLLEKMIDIRYKYLKEKDFENFRYASEIKRNEYEPVVKEMVDFLEEKGMIDP